MVTKFTRNNSVNETSQKSPGLRITYFEGGVAIFDNEMSGYLELRWSSSPPSALFSLFLLHFCHLQQVSICKSGDLDTSYLTHCFLHSRYALFGC